MKKYLGILVLSILSLAGCKEVQLKDGRVPKEYLPAVQKLLGEFKGQVKIIQTSSGGGTLQASKIAASVQARLDGDKLSFESDIDLAGAGCKSTVGDALTIFVDNDVVVGVRFQFDPNNCRMGVQGRMLSLYYSKDSKNMTSSIFHSEETIDHGPWKEHFYREIQGKFERNQQ